MRESIVSAKGRRIALERRTLPAREIMADVARPAGAGPDGIAPRLREVIGRMRRLTVHDRDPERFHVEKSEICRDLETIERDMNSAASARSGQWGARK